MLCVMQDGWPARDFNEYIYGSRSHWPTEEEVREFESWKKPWPCTTTLSLRCKCSILATKGVVPSELGYEYYCGNNYGEYWVRILTTKLKLLMILSLC